MRKQLDQRIPILINNNVKNNHRSFIVLVGDKGRDQVVNLHFLLSQARISARPNVLWCYKKELGFTRCVRAKLSTAFFDLLSQSPKEA
jgi:N-acetyltransferase 10